MPNVTSKWNVAWVQPDGPGTVPQILSCFAVDSVSTPKGGWTPNYCWNAVTGKYELTSMTQDPPDLPSSTFEGLTRKQADYMEKALRSGCPLYMYINTTSCPPRDAFLGFDRGKVLKAARLENEEESGLLARDSQEQTLESYDFVMEGVEKYFALDEFRRTTAVTDEALDLIFFGGPTCLDDCGPEIGECEIGYIVHAADGVGGTADVLYTTDGGTTWATTSADPFAADENISSIVAVPISGHTWRLIVSRGTTDGANPHEIAYADVDIIATPGTTAWTTVNVGSTNGEYAEWNGCLFALDAYHIWCGTDQGEIYFSDDAGLTWTAQGAAAGDNIRYVRFINEHFGVAVGGSTGASHVLLYTTNGGDTWSAVTFTGPGATVMANCVEVFNEQKLLVGFEDGSLWMTWDRGSNWTELPMPIVAGLTAWGDINDVMKIDECCVFAVAEATVSGNSKGIIMRSVNGGYDWDAWYTADGDGTLGLQAVHACTYNEAFSAGDTETTAMIYEVTD